MRYPLLLTALALLAGCGGTASQNAPAAPAASSSSASASSAASFSSSSGSTFSSASSVSSVFSSSSFSSASASSSSVSSSTALFTDPELNTYYASALGEKGEALKAALHGIIKSATFLSYDEVYETMTESDRDTTNRDGDYVVLIYSRLSVPAQDKCHSLETACWNREHLWPKSLGVGYDETVASYTDLHHLRPADAQVNLDRGNRRFAEASTPYDGIDGTYYDDTAWSWEPADAIKGDIARALLYMTVRYEGEGKEPDLELLPHDESTQRPGDLCTMLSWSRLDPVSLTEQRRNDTVYRYQKNRNPFVDRPAWADEIYGAECE